jgi:hypothetical protein
VPLVKRLAELNRFGAGDVLLRWQRLLIRGGLANRLTATQLMSASFASVLALRIRGSLLLLLWGAGALGILLFGFAPGAGDRHPFFQRPQFLARNKIWSDRGIPRIA